MKTTHHTDSPLSSCHLMLVCQTGLLLWGPTVTFDLSIWETMTAASDVRLVCQGTGSEPEAAEQRLKCKLLQFVQRFKQLQLRYFFIFHLDFCFLSLHIVNNLRHELTITMSQKK